MDDKLENVCYMCGRIILGGEKCIGLLDGKIELDLDDVIFYDNDDRSDTVLICNDCRREHIDLMLHGERLGVVYHNQIRYLIEKVKKAETDNMVLRNLIKELQEKGE